MASKHQKTVVLSPNDFVHLYYELSKMFDEQPFTGTLEVSPDISPFNLKRVLTHRMNFKDGKLHGVSEEFFENGKLKLREHYKNVHRHGIREEFFENGKLKKRDRYKNDELHGVCELFDHNGELYLRTQYKKDKIQN